jgi:hypothetical protein
MANSWMPARLTLTVPPPPPAAAAAHTVDAYFKLFQEEEEEGALTHTHTRDGTRFRNPFARHGRLVAS